MKHEADVIQKLHDELVLEFLCLCRVVFLITLHLLYLMLQLHYLFDVSKWRINLNEFLDILLDQSDKSCYRYALFLVHGLVVFLGRVNIAGSVFRGYFRIRGKHPIYSKRASYFGSISWFDSPTSIKIQSISGNPFKQVIWFANIFMIYCSCLQFLVSFQRSWE